MTVLALVPGALLALEATLADGVRATRVAAELGPTFGRAPNG
jgi:hypothetical protein